MTKISYIRDKQTPRNWFTVIVTHKKGICESRGVENSCHSQRTCSDMLCTEAKNNWASLE